MKTCTKCLFEKEEEEFYKKKNECKICNNKKRLKNRKKQMSTWKGFFTVKAYSLGKRKMEDRNLPYSTLTAEQLLHIYKLQKGLCYYSGVELQLSNPQEHRGSIIPNDFTCSIERVDSKKGYMYNNVILVTWLANRIKQAQDDPDMMSSILKEKVIKNMKRAKKNIKRRVWVN